MRDSQFQNTVAAPSGQAERIKDAIVAGRYQMIRLLGTGGMGEVWEARHMLLDRVVALKLMSPQLQLVADRLVIEARALARVRHPAVVEVYDCGTLENGTPYIAMERLVGETLAKAVRRGPLPVVAAVRLFIPILDGLAAAHRAGVIHRDLLFQSRNTPQNFPEISLAVEARWKDAQCLAPRNAVTVERATVQKPSDRTLVP